MRTLVAPSWSPGADPAACLEQPWSLWGWARIRDLPGRIASGIGITVIDDPRNHSAAPRGITPR